MKTILKVYKNPHNYSLDFPDEIKTVESCTKALKLAKGNLYHLLRQLLFLHQYLTPELNNLSRLN